MLTVKTTFNSFSDIPIEEVSKEFKKYHEGILTETEVMDNLIKKSKRE